MATYQNSAVDTDRLILGNYAMYTAATSGTTWVNMGPGQLTAFKHTIEKFNILAGNAPDPMEGIGVETVKFSFDLIEYDASVLSALQGGLVSSTVTTSQSTIKAGGNTTLTKRAYKLDNNRFISGASVRTVITIFKGSIDDGMTLVPKSDNDSDPLNVFQFSITGELDTTLSIGTQLYTIVKTEV